MSQTQPTDVDFDIEKEVWNTYDLVDGTRVKMRSVLIKLVRFPSSAKVGEFDYNASFQNLVTAFVHPRNKGPTGRQYTEQEIASLPKEDVNFTTECEDWNIYKLPDGTRLKTKLVVSSILKITEPGVYNLFGEPIYVTNSTNVLAPSPRKT
jgi:hypothetical protein